MALASMLKRDLVKLVERSENELKVQQELNRDQGTHIARLLKERAQQDAVIARFVKETGEQPARLEVGRQETRSRNDAPAS